MAFRIYTKTGDAGETGLFGGKRVSKDDARVEAYGSVDELSSFLAHAHGGCDDPEMASQLHAILHQLFELGAQLATPSDAMRRGTSGRITLDDVQWLESCIDAAEQSLAPLKQFILPGGCELASRLHIARTVCRRSERRVVTLRSRDGSVAEETVIYLNRLNDLLFVLARLANQHGGVEDVSWRPRS